jgi:hypothetical protein
MLPERPQRDRCASAWHAVNLATFGGDSASATLESRRKFVPLAKFRDMTAPSHRTPLVDRTSFLRIVSVYKFLQALLLSGVGLATLRLVRPEVAAEFGQWVQDLPVGFIQHTAVQPGPDPWRRDLGVRGAVFCGSGGPLVPKAVGRVAHGDRDRGAHSTRDLRVCRAPVTAALCAAGAERGGCRDAGPTTTPRASERASRPRVGANLRRMERESGQKRT